jgi:nucleoside 2-deoxyribosyltransferase
MTTPKIYLAGPIAGLNYTGSTDWRNQLIDQLAPDIEGLSPMRAKQYLKTVGVITDSYEEHAMSTATAITTRDHFDCMRADLVLVNFLGATTVSIGTVMEVAWAHAYKKPIILVQEQEGNIHEHPMIRSVVGFRVNTLEQALTVAKAILLPFQK